MERLAGTTRAIRSGGLAVLILLSSMAAGVADERAPPDVGALVIALENAEPAGRIAAAEAMAGVGAQWHVIVPALSAAILFPVEDTSTQEQSFALS